MARGGLRIPGFRERYLTVRTVYAPAHPTRSKMLRKYVARGGRWGYRWTEHACFVRVALSSVFVYILQVRCMHARNSLTY